MPPASGGESRATGRPDFSGDGGPADVAALHSPQDVLYDEAKRRLIIADTCNHRIRAIGAEGRIETIAGNGQCGNAGDDGPAINASFNNPQGIASSMPKVGC